MTEPWNVSGMQGALPEQPQQSNPVSAPGQPQASEAWGKIVPYDYTESDAERVWGSHATVYKYDGTEGDVGPEHPELENQLFGPPEQRFGAGVDFSKIAEIKVLQEGDARIKSIDTFEEAGLHPAMLKNLQLAGYKTPTPIQKYCFPGIAMGRDLIGIAQTGSGKTAAYIVPIINKLMGKIAALAGPRPNEAVGYVRAEPLVLVVVPTRELAIQIFNVARKFCYRTMLRPCAIYGGGPVGAQREQIMQGCDILISTPGRICDFLKKNGILSLHRLRYIVIDEADEMLMDDWNEEIDQIMGCGGESGQINYMLFSATFPASVRKLAKDHLAMDHLRISVGRIGSSHANIIQDVIYVAPELKRNALIDTLEEMAHNDPGRTIIFVNSKRMADEVDDFLFHKGYPSTSLHSDRTQREREDAMRAFRSGQMCILVATGVSARGIDVHHVKLVINYDLPDVGYGGILEYTHRIGRTGRMGHKGIAKSFYNEDRDSGLAVDLTKLLMETKQPVPDFLQQYIPEGADLENFKIEDDASENGDGGGADVNDSAWGADAGAGDDNAGSTTAWGAGSKSGGDTGDDANGHSSGHSGGHSGGDFGGGFGGGLDAEAPEW